MSTEHKAATDVGMLVMPSNNNGIQIGHLAGKYPGKLGHLYSPGGQRGPYRFMPYALDNGAYGAFMRNEKWNSKAWLDLLHWAKMSGQAPLWTLVPDVVGDRARTLDAWEIWSPVAAKYGWPLAFAVQDGMTILDVPKGTHVVFVGGSTEWKWKTAASWCKAFRRVHIGRVNTFQKLVLCEEMGAESVDGTGWTRGDQKQWNGLVAWLEGEHKKQMKLLEAS